MKYVCKFLFCKLKVMPMYNAIAFGFRDDDGGIPLVYIETRESFIRVQYTYISW